MGKETSGRGGRGRGHGRSHGERGGRHSTSRNSQDERSNNKTNPYKLKTKLEDAMFDIGPVTTRAHEYHNNLKFLLSHIQQKFMVGDDIVKTIKDKQHVDFDKNQPAIALSKNKEKIRAIEQAFLDE